MKTDALQVFLASSLLLDSFLQLTLKIFVHIMIIMIIAVTIVMIITPQFFQSCRLFQPSPDIFRPHEESL